MNDGPIPAGPTEITPAWLTAALRAGDAIRRVAVTSAAVEVIGQDRGFTGVVARVRLRYDGVEARAPASVVVKLPIAARDTPSAYRAARQANPVVERRSIERCAREIAFYQQVVRIGPLPVPRLYYGAADLAGARMALVLEDGRSARAGDALHGCAPEDAPRVIEQIAQVHAQWWEHPARHTLDWIPTWGGDPWVAQDRYSALVEPFLTRFGDRVPVSVRRLIDGLGNHYAGIRRALARVPSTLIHGDLHLDNILFQPPGEDPDVLIIDWQSVMWGPVVLDLAPFLVGSLAIETRRARELEILRRYHDRLVARGVDSYPLARLREDFRLALLCHLGATVIWLGSVALDGLAGRERALVDDVVGSGRLFTALDDYELVEDFAFLLPTVARK
ncbi:MAG TPA: aminoglycoside phosphotransferase family protein [Chloroflexota bacterium]|nr:aminoglycoside phosphotransferase family protein [Chloroflexota bacterium]